MGETIITIFNGYLQIVEIISHGHLRLTVLAITKSPLTLRVFSYLNTSTIHVPPTNFLFHYVVGVVRCSFPLLLCLLSFFFPFVSNPLFLSFSVIMRGSVSKEKTEKMLRGQNLREKLSWVLNGNNPGQGKPTRKICNV
jgi:hypothetical protein